MPAIFPVPNTHSFSFRQVTKYIYGDTNAGRSLRNTFPVSAQYNFDERYFGSMNSLVNYRNYLSPINSLSTNTLTWDYNNLSTQTFIVYTNKYRWYFLEESSYFNFNVKVYDSSNTFEVTDNIYQNGMYVRVTPKANNTSGAAYYGNFFMSDYWDYQWGTMQAIQDYQGGGGGGSHIVYVYGSVGDATFTLPFFSCTLNVGDQNAYIIYTPDNYAGSNYTIYWYITRGATSIGSGSKSANYNGAQRSLTIAMNEAAIENATYNITGYTSLG